MYHIDNPDDMPRRVKPPRGGFKTLNEMAKFTVDTTNQWLWSWTKEKLFEDITERLDSKLENLVLKVLGLEKSWDEWRISRPHDCVAPLSTLITDHAQELAAKWINEKMPEITAKPLTKKQIKGIKDDYSAEFYRAICNQLHERAFEDAELFLNNIAMLGEDREVQKYLDEVKGLDILAKADIEGT